MTRPLRFATQTGSAPSGEAWIARTRQLEDLGITYFCIRGAHVDELAQVVRELTGLAVTPAI